ncbi:CPBP family intramembrane glutamic endopeptidase [Natronoarchaeum rubrum]|uniref:CPBP family intramembrane glutamic endopeptidase n=1 Tax=Natronoarchaeum rubrum TaxID=755311 RepID=UPI00211188DE|nr:CPBP family intramembrane glutamic endopeptidase [Natronoarchaeum rubrum]
MSDNDPAGAGVVAGSAVGVATGAFVLVTLVLGRAEVIADFRTAMPAGRTDLSPEIVFWITAIVGPAFRLAIGTIVGSLVGVVYDWLDSPGALVLFGIVAIVGALDTVTTNVPASQSATVAVVLGSWIIYVPLFLYIHGRNDSRTATAAAGRSDVATRSAGGSFPVDRRPFALLTAVGVLGVLAGAPYVLALQSGGEPIAVAAGFVFTNGLLVTGAVIVGLRAGPAIGFDAPTFDRWKPSLRSQPLLVPATAGALVGVALIALDAWVFAPRVSTAGNVEAPAQWRSWLLVLYGGITEELLLRFGLLTGLVWVATTIFRGNRPDGTDASQSIVWGAIVASAVGFGALHLSAAALTFEMTAAVVVRTLTLNGLAGVVFGWLYWRRGLVGAIAAHLATDLVLNVVAPLALGG